MRTIPRQFVLTAAIAITLGPPQITQAEDIKTTPLYARIRASLDAVPAIDTHDHLRPFDELPGNVKTDQGTRRTLYSVLSNSYFTWINRLSPWPEGKPFEAWWEKAQHDFDNARATSFYRYLQVGIKDLYGADLDTLSAEQALELNSRIEANYLSPAWLEDVIKNRANIDLMFIDPYWARLTFSRAYDFSVPVLNVTEFVKGTHEKSFPNPLDSPFAYAARFGRSIESLDDFLRELDTIYADAVASDVACLKTTLAYQRTLEFADVPRQRAAAIFGRPYDELAADERRDFEDFIFWRLTELSARHDLPFQIHTGQARIQGSNPMLLVDLIAANPQTKFVLFHGGFPWVGETGVIAMRHRNVWVDSVWLPLLSYTTARRAYQEWLEVMPSDRIMWGADGVDAEGIYSATVFTRQCLAEALAEKVSRGELLEEHALRIGRQILRDNAVALFPKLARQSRHARGEKLKTASTGRASGSADARANAELARGAR